MADHVNPRGFARYPNLEPHNQTLVSEDEDPWDKMYAPEESEQNNKNTLK